MATSQVQREEGEKFILVGTVFDDYVPTEAKRDGGGTPRLFNRTLCVGC